MWHLSIAYCAFYVYSHILYLYFVVKIGVCVKIAEISGIVYAILKKNLPESSKIIHNFSSVFIHTSTVASVLQFAYNFIQLYAKLLSEILS